MIPGSQERRCGTSTSRSVSAFTEFEDIQIADGGAQFGPRVSHRGEGTSLSVARNHEDRREFPIRRGNLHCMESGRGGRGLLRESGYTERGGQSFGLRAS